MDLSAYVAQETEAWIPFKDGYEFKIGYSGSDAYRNMLQSRFTKARRVNRNRDLPPEQVNQVTREVMAKHILFDWRGPEEFVYEGKDVPHTEAGALTILTISPEIRDFIEAESADIGNFQPAKKEDQSATADLKSRSGMESKVGAGISAST